MPLHTDHEPSVIDLHKTDLKAGKEKLKKFTPNSNDWWEVKHKVDKYSIAYAQALNLANERVKDAIYQDDGGVVNDDESTKEEIENWHLYFYKRLTAPYRTHKDEFRDGTKKAKPEKGTVNIDGEIDEMTIRAIANQE